MQKAKIMDGPHAGEVIEVCEPVPEVIQLRVALKEPVSETGSLPICKDLRWGRYHEYRVYFFVEDLEQRKGEWRAVLA